MEKVRPRGDDGFADLRLPTQSAVGAAPKFASIAAVACLSFRAWASTCRVVRPMSFGMEARMAGFPAWVFGGCLLALLVVLPAQADPFCVRVYGRTYKVDPRYPADEAKGPKPREAMKSLPADLATGPGFRPSHDQVLAEVEERVWIARNQLDEKIEETAASEDWRSKGDDPKAVRQEITGSLATGTAQTRSPELQKLYDRDRALNLLARELRRSLDLPVRPPG